jgi:hypothetical protein
MEFRMNKDLTIALYKAINEADAPREIKHWHSSSIAKCPRALYFERKKIAGIPDNEPGGGKKLRWRSGHAIEATIRPELEKIYPKLITNVRLTNATLDLTGEFDCYDPESRTLISVKSVHDFAFITVNGVNGLKDKVGVKISQKTGKEIGDYGLKTEPYIHHQWQEHSYVQLMSHKHTVLSRLGELPVPEHIIYVYITLGGLIACYETDVKPELLSLVERKTQYLKDCWENNIVPACLCQEGREMYLVSDQYCPYKTATGCCDEALNKELV